MTIASMQSHETRLRARLGLGSGGGSFLGVSGSIFLSAEF